MAHEARGNKVVLVHACGDVREVAVCNSMLGESNALLVARKLNKARDLNDRQRKYTAAARLIAECETLPGFSWLDI